MKQFKLFFACALMSLFSLGQVWAGTGSITFDFEDDGAHRASGNNSYAAGPQSYSENSVDISCTYMDVVTTGTPLSGIANALGRVAKNTTNSPVLLIGPIDMTDKTITGITYYTKGVGTQSQVCEYSTNGSSWTTAVASFTMPTSSTQKSSGTISVAGTSTFYLRITTSVESSTGSTRDLQIDDVVISYSYEDGGTPTCANPTFSPVAGAVLSGTEVTISSTTDGATIYYTTNGDDPTTSSATTQPIVITTATTIKAIAVKDGCNNSSVASAAYTIAAPKTIAQVLSDISTTEGDAFLLNDVTVTYANGKNIYVKDASGYILVYDNNSVISGAANGKVLQGLWGKAKTYNGLPEISTITVAPTVSDGTAVDPLALDAYPTDGDLNKYVTLEDVTFAAAGSFSGSVNNVDGTFEGNTLVLRNTFKLSGVSVETGKSYRVVGIVQKYNSNYQVYPITITEIVEAGAPEAPTFSPAAGTYTSVQSVELECATDGATIYYTTNGDTPDDGSTPYTGAIEVNADMTIKAIAYKAGVPSSVATAAYTINLPLPSHDFQVTHMFTEASGFDFSEWSTPYAVRQATYTDDKVIFAGASKQGSGQAIDDRPVTKNKAISLVLTNVAKVITAVRFDYAQWGTKTQTLTMQYSTDHGASYNNFDPVVSATDFVLQVLTLPAGVNAIQVTGSSSSNQVGLTSIAFDLDDVPVVHGSITYVENGANEDIADVADAISLPDPLPTVTKGGNSFGGWFTDPEFNTPAVAGAALTGNVTLYAKWVVIPYWATVYSSNVSVAHTGSGTDNGTITIGSDEPYTLVKAGASSSTGTIVVTVPASTHTLHFHAFAWGGKTAKIEISGVDNPTVTEFNIAGESGASGAGNDFTLVGNPVDQYFYVSFDAVAAETEIVFSKATGSADHRFFFYGVNQEGGVLPVLESIEISGDLNTKSGYKVGDALDLDGLTVAANYTLGGTPQAPVDITSDPELTLTYDPLVENQTSVTITATYKGETDNITINDLEPVASADPKIYVNPSLTVNFGSVEVGEAVPADKTITVTLTNVAAATATLGGTKPEAFSIDKTALVDGDVITISVIASTAAAASYSATITITDDAAAATEKVVNLSFAVTEPAVEESPVSTTSKWVVATTIEDGMQVLITGVKDEVTYAMGEQKSNNRAAYAATVDGEGVLTPGTGTMAFTLVDQGDGTYAIRTSNGKYLYAAASGSNHLKTQDEVDVNAKWTLTVNSAIATGSSNRNVMQFNGGSSKLFSCYSSASQEEIKFYVPQAVTPTPDYTEIRTGLTAGNYYTVCYSKAMTAIKGGTLWSFNGKDADFAYIVQEEAPFVAGRPYIIYATDTKLEAVVEGDDAAAGNHNGLYGTLVDMTNSDLLAAGATYMLKNNMLQPVGDGYLNANRAYVILSEISAPVPAPGKIIKTMPLQGQTVTGIDELNASDTPAKLMINGQLFILRGEKMYDAQGRLVK